MSNELADGVRAWRLMRSLSERETRAYKQNPRGHSVDLRLSHDDIWAITQALEMVIVVAGGFERIAEADEAEIDRILGRKRPLLNEQPLTGPGIYRPSKGVR